VETGTRIDYTGRFRAAIDRLLCRDHHLAGQLVILVALAVGVRLSIVHQPAWYDEAFTLWLLRLPIPNMLSATIGDVHPPLYYLLAWSVTRTFGLSIVTVRIVSVTFGAASLLLLAKLKLPTPTLTLWLAAFSPFLIAYSGEARMYTMLLFLILLGVYAAQNKKPALLALAVALGMWTHNLMALYIAPIFVYAWHEVGLRRTAQAALLAMALYVPWLPSLIKQLTAVRSAYWIPPVTTGRIIGLTYEATTEIATNPHTLLITACVTLSLLVLGVWRAVQQRHWLVLWMSWGPLVVGILISALFRPVLMSPPRPLIGATPFLLAQVALGVNWLRRAIGKPAWALVIVLLVLVGNLYVAPAKKLPLVSELNPTGNCYHLSVSSIVVSTLYAPNCRHYVWRGVDNLAQSLTAQTKQAMGFDTRPIEDVPSGDLWLFFDESPDTAPVAKQERDRILSTYHVVAKYSRENLGIINEYIYRLEN